MTAVARLAQHLQVLTRTEMATVSDRAGVPRRIGARARARRKVSATAYMLLCSAVGLDANLDCSRISVAAFCRHHRAPVGSSRGCGREYCDRRSALVPGFALRLSWSPFAVSSPAPIALPRGLLCHSVDRSREG